MKLEGKCDGSSGGGLERRVRGRDDQDPLHTWMTFLKDK